MATGPSLPYHVPKVRHDNTRALPAYHDQYSNSDSSLESTDDPSEALLRRLNLSKHHRFSISRTVALAAVSFIMLAFLHINYGPHHYIPRFNQSGNIASTGSTASPEDQRPQLLIPLDQPQRPSPQTPKPVYTKPPKTNSTSPTLGMIVSDNDLTTTVQQSDGEQIKLFKPAFFKDAVAAKREMGSFMQTLKSMSQLVRSSRLGFDSNGYNDRHSDKNENEDKEKEEDDDQDRKDTTSGELSSRYFTYLPMGGGNNQFTSLQKAALLAKDLNRTLILPPISPNQHIPVWAGPRYSRFYDLDTFVAKSGIPILEWHDIKKAPETVPGNFGRQWEEFSEDLPCTPNGGIGVGNANLYDKFRQQFLLKFRMTIPEVDATKGKSKNYNYARDVLLKDAPASTTPGPDGVDPNMWKCLSCPYFLGGSDLGGRTWNEVGVHLQFNDKTEAMADDILDTVLGHDSDHEASNKGLLQPSKPARAHPEFIIIHLRRGDIVNKCPAGKAEKDCIVQIEAIAEKVEEIERNRRVAALKKHQLDDNDFVHRRLPVLVTTNEERKEELEKLEKLGWILLDHGDEEEKKDGKSDSGKRIKLGTMSKLGPWYPPMLDAVLLTRGNYLIGMQNSRMSILAAQRGAAWYGHKTMLM